MEAKITGLKDGHYRIDHSTLKTSFKKEANLNQLITDNVDLFIKEWYDDEVVSFENEKPLNTNTKKKIRGSLRCDLYVEGKKSNYIIEFKNPKYKSENRTAIGQVLNYKRYCENAKIVLITDFFDLDTGLVIAEYNLPIDYYYANKSQILKYIKTT